ncbi:MAG: YcfL family protein [Sedimentisphaerales bacterium]|nr:YcfL family protein [Sedimentisphaerales bacterium]
MRILTVLCVLLMVLSVGCGSPSKDARVNARRGVGSDSLANNVITRPIRDAFEGLIGAGIVIDDAVVNRNNSSNFLQVFVSGHNKSSKTKRFRYRVEWLDADGMVIETKASVWQRMSAMGKSPFQIKCVAPRAEAVNFRMDTRKWE